MTRSPLDRPISSYLDQTRLDQLALDPEWAPARRPAAVVIPLRRNPVMEEANRSALAVLRLAQAEYRKTVPATVALRRNWSAEIVDAADEQAGHQRIINNAETLTPLQARLFAEIDKRLETLILSMPSGTARNMICDANIELSTALNVLKGKHEQPAVAPTPMSQLTAPHCQCEACVGGLIHASDCAVHNAPALPKGPCDCGKLR